MDYIFKEVYFDNFCAKCVYKEKEEWEEPCDECLENPVNEYSHKPVKFVLKEKEDA